MAFDPNMLVQAVRGVGSKRGYSYYAYGLYAPTMKRDGTWYYRLVGSGPEFRSDVNGRTKFANVPVRDGTRHGSPCV